MCIPAPRNTNARTCGPVSAPAAQSVSLAEGKKHATPSHAHEQRVDALLLLDGTVADFRVVNLAVKFVLFGLMLSVVLA